MPPDGERQPKSTNEGASKDAAERIERIEKTLATETPDEDLIRHDLEELDKAVLSLNDTDLAEKARILRMRYELAAHARYTEEMAEELGDNPQMAEEFFWNLVENTLDAVEDMRQARGLAPQDSEVLRLQGDEDAPKGVEETEAVIEWLRAAVKEIKETF